MADYSNARLTKIYDDNEIPPHNIHIFSSYHSRNGI